MQTTPTCNRGLSPGARVALCVAIGASLAVSLDPATGFALAGGLFVALSSGRRC
jgi:hypothetical protein